MAYTQEELKVAFDKVANSKHWKNPIKKVISGTKAELDVIIESVIHFTATVPVITKKGSNRFLVTAVGYRMGPAGP